MTDLITSRFAPVDLGADLTALPAQEQQALARLVAAARFMDALFLRQVWAGNDALLQRLARREGPEAAAQRRAFLLNKGPWSRLDGDRPFVAGVPAKPGGANFYPADATRGEIERWLDGLPSARPGRRGRVLHHGPPRRDGRAPGGPLQPRVPAGTGRSRPPAARGCRSDGGPDAPPLSHAPRGRVPVERLLRQRRGVDGARCAHRTDDRPVRGLRRRVVQRQGRVRGVRHRARRPGDRRTDGLLRMPAVAGGRAADRPRVTAIRVSARSPRSASST